MGLRGVVGDGVRAARRRLRSSEEARVLELRLAGVRGRVVPVEQLADPVPAVRRSAAWALGVRGAERDALLGAARSERCDEVRLAMAIAAVRAGADVRESWALLSASFSRVMATWYVRMSTAYRRETPDTRPGIA